MDQTNMSADNKPKTCNCVHHKVGPIATILIGLDIILGSLNVLNAMWTTIIIGVLLIVLGGAKLGASKCNCCGKDKM